MGSAHPNIAPYDRYAASDGDVFLGVVNNGQFKRFCECVSRPDLAADPRFVDSAARLATRLVADIGTFLQAPTPAAEVLIDYDSGQPVVVSARKFGSVRTELETRKADLPALYFGARAITYVPALAAMPPACDTHNSLKSTVLKCGCCSKALNSVFTAGNMFTL